MKGKKITNEEFVRAWQTSSSGREVHKKLGLPDQHNNGIFARAAYLRKKGVPLKSFGKPGPKIDVAALTKLAEDCLKNGNGTCE